MSISDVEKNYMPRNWVEIEDFPDGAGPLDATAFLYFCNTSSGRFQRLLQQGQGNRAILIDYELMSVDIDITCGALFHQMDDGKLVMTVFTGPASSRHFIESY